MVTLGLSGKLCGWWHVRWLVPVYMYFGETYVLVRLQSTVRQ